MGSPTRGETGEGSSGAWEKVGLAGTCGTLPGRPGQGCSQRVKEVVGPIGVGGE